MRLILMLATFAMASAAGVAQAAAPPPPPSSTEVSAVTVTAKRNDAVASFVAQVTAPTRYTQMSRWDRFVCTGVMGLPEKHAQYLNDRLAANAVAVGLQPGLPKCRPNVLILVAPDADTLTAQVVKQYPNAFARYAYADQTPEGGTYHTRGLKALREFTLTSRPVRWWHITATHAYSSSIPSRIHPPAEENFSNVIIIVDAKRASGAAVSYQALCDYISMVALAQIDPRADVTDLPSILNLFRDSDRGVTPPAGLTEWDRSYLQSLYTVRADVTDNPHEQREIIDDMKRKAKRAEEKPKTH